VFCAWSPTSSKDFNASDVDVSKGESANDHSRGSSIRKTTFLIVTSMVLCVIALLMEGGASMIAAFLIHVAAHIAIVVGGRAESIAI
jgi:hypothetical protein